MRVFDINQIRIADDGKTVVISRPGLIRNNAIEVPRGDLRKLINTLVQVERGSESVSAQEDTEGHY